MKEIVKIGLIGSGRIGRLHANLITNRVPGARVEAVCDVIASSAEECAKEIGVGKYSDDPQNIFDDPEVDAVFVCSSTDTHAEMIQRAAKAGKAIFCEKPIAFDTALIVETLKVVKEAGVSLQVGFNRRFDPNFARVKESALKGDVGDIHMVRITSRDPSPPPIEYVKRSGGLYFDMTIHDFDMARFLSGSEVAEVYANGTVLVDEKIGEAGDIDTAAINLVFENGALGFIENSRQAVYGYDQRIEVFGSKGMAEASNVQTNTVSIWTDKQISQDLPPFFFLERYTDAYINELSSFVKSIQEGTEPSVTGNDGLEPVYIAQACMISMKEKRPVKLSEVRL